MKRLSIWIVAVVMAVLFSGCAGMIKTPAEIEVGSVGSMMALEHIGYKMQSPITMLAYDYGGCELYVGRGDKSASFHLTPEEQVKAIGLLDKALEWAEISKKENIEVSTGKEVGVIKNFIKSDSLTVIFFNGNNRTQVRLDIYDTQAGYRGRTIYSFLTMEQVAQLKAMFESVPEYVSKAQNMAVRASRLQ